MNELSWEARLSLELERAESARNEGKEGMARVLARRAAGIVAAQYLQSKGEIVEVSSAYDQLKMLSADPSIDDETRKRVDHFLVRVTTGFTLPIQADLIADARWLAAKLLQIENL
ncbi:MAG: hypothetical protein EHM41_07380 [Chloroflexi bacterium]|nr:MAG: hypothetical protein EHM41_07380 [Chloroflexota bacterium]